MKTEKIITSAATIFFFKISAAFAQFTVYNPPLIFSISDIEYNSTLAKVVVASNSGVFFFDGGTTWIQTTTANGLPSNDVKCITTTQSGWVLAGTAGGLAKWNGTLWNAYTLNTTQVFSFVSAIYVRPGTDTTYGTNNGKLLKKGTAATATNITFSPAVGLFTHIGYMNPPGTLEFIIGTSTNGAVIYNIPTTQTFIVNTSSTPIPSNNILSHDIEGNKTYDGTDKGVYIPDFTNFPSMTHVIYNTGNSQLPSNIIQAVAVRNGVQWYGTPNGLAKMQGTTWTLYNTGNSNLPSNNVIELAYDIGGNILWIGTGDGKLSKIDLALSMEDGLNSQDNIVYPNPSNGKFTVATAESKWQMADGKIEIYNVMGEKVYSSTINHQPLAIDLGSQPAGVYFIQAKTDKEIATQKLIIQQ